MAATQKIDPEILDVLKRGQIIGLQYMLPAQLDRKTYEKVNKVLVNAGGKWNRTAKAHVFPSDPATTLGLALDSGVTVNQQQLYQSFYTPDDLADEIVQTANVHRRSVLEPSAGDGAIVRALVRAGAMYVQAVEIRLESCDAIRGWVSSQGLAYVSVTQQDFLSVVPVQGFDSVVMNPPFTKGQDVKHIEHALKFLRPGGRLVSVVSAGASLSKLPSDARVRPLGPGRFKSSGTDVSTAVVVIDR